MGKKRNMSKKKNIDTIAAGGPSKKTTSNKNNSQSFQQSSIRKKTCTRGNGKIKRKRLKKNGKSVKADEVDYSLFPIAASDTDSDDEKDRSYRVEYASTARATCRSCDEKIEKKSLRIATRPLFRGKPGFVSYRHL